ncbi:glycerophosphodiester phosphodiesterase activity [Vibrio sp. B1FIG11]|uniref:glycerophosphodiester phosphodiesterase family protein n=1 Tax=Vibrio sp. B1FIG11 TaxID=2751177 RepID=UPI001AF223EE|nr:glycerophosphodiester phosphodiesterase family protein [Vibrio sp. B1FIG11]CAD7808998.1 glycerophosphodiester phosphodiesterase activity [Vibrio sp. B1FIG11]CAE6908282.1 glycerophosphodiester phosphodiesterase activity [Vibrio sp. B1FIG11]
MPNHRAGVKVKAVVLMLLTCLVPMLAWFAYSASQVQTYWQNCTEVWAHRGLTVSAEENTISAFNEALKAGARGIEIDVFFDPAQQRFLVKHEPEPREQELTLESVFTTFGSGTQYWLDFKNLYRLNIDDRNAALVRLVSLADPNISRRQIVIESVNERALSTFTHQGFNTSYWLNLNDDVSDWQYVVYGVKTHIKYWLGWFTAVSTDISYYTDRFRIAFFDIPTLLFTVNQPMAIRKIEHPNIKVVLTDIPIYSQFSYCHQQGGES